LREIGILNGHTDLKKMRTSRALVADRNIGDGKTLPDQFSSRGKVRRAVFIGLWKKKMKINL